MNKKREIGVLRRAYNTEGDDFYSRFLFGHGNIRTCAYGRDKQLEYDKSFNPVFQNLLEMKMVKDKSIKLITDHLKSVAEATDGKYHGNQIDVNEPIDDELNIFFKDFFIRGEMAIRALIAHSRYMGSNIGFLFAEDERKFNTGSKKFVLNGDDERFKALNAFIANHKAAWYAGFKELRCKIEHEGWSLPNVQYTLDSNDKVVIRFPAFSNGSLEEVMNSMWQNITLFCEEVVVFLLSLKLRDSMVIVFVPEDKRDKNLPVRYIVSHKDFPGVPLQCG